MASEAGILRCPNCGGDVEEAARTCGYCRAELATVRCHGCYAMNSARSVHCRGCGRELGLEPLGDGDERPCPSCKKPLDRFAGDGGVLLDCASCGGQFVEHELLRSLLEEREVTGLAVARRVKKSTLSIGAVRYLPCPSCSSLMNRKNFGGESGVVVDVCSLHGEWFDAGELPRVLEFVASGGLTRSRARQRERERAAERERTSRMIAGPQPAAAPSFLSASSDMESLADATVELVDWLLSLWKRRR